MKNRSRSNFRVGRRLYRRLDSTINHSPINPGVRFRGASLFIASLARTYDARGWLHDAPDSSAPVCFNFQMVCS